MKHFFLHHFPLSSLASGLLNIAAFNPTAATLIDRFLRTHKYTLRLFCNARESKLASTSAKLRSETSLSVTPPKEDKEETKKEAKKEKKRPPFKEPRQSSQMNSSIDEDMDA